MAELSLVPREDPESFTDENDLGSMTFRRAILTFIETRKPFLHPRTYRDYLYCTKWLIKFFANHRPNEITAMHIRKYQIERKERCGPQMINHECSLIQQLLKRCGTWERVGIGYQPLPLPRESPGRAITEDEEKRLLRAGASNPRWESAYLFALISLHTTMGPGEVQTLRRKDIDLEKRTVSINPEGAKNRGRMRLIPLNDIALRVCQEALARAERKGSILPEHYVFPFRRKVNSYDPTRRCTTFRASWEEMLAFAGIGHLRQYDLRHTAITRLCENPENSEDTVEAIAGHITHAMKKRYSHVRVEARRAALAGLVPERLDKHFKFALPKADSDEPHRSGPSLNNEQVLDLLSAGLPAKVIVAKIDRCQGNFDTAPVSLKQLKSAGVPDAVILAMVKAG